MKIMRVWRGWTRTSDATAYQQYMVSVAQPAYEAVEGNRGVHMTRRDVGDNTEFCMVTFWESWEAVRRFAGDEPELAVFYAEDDRYLVDRELSVAHYEVYAEA
jgi:heme-degrading monooxygenase HmoA